MEIRRLQDFLVVAETGNVTRAAAMRNTSQAAFSRRIQQLEAWFGVPLIDRSILPTMDQGEIIEDRPKDEFFGSPRSERAQLLFSKILSH